MKTHPVLPKCPGIGWIHVPQPVDLCKEVFVAEEGKKFYLSDTYDVTDVETSMSLHVFVIFYSEPFICYSVCIYIYTKTY